MTTELQFLIDPDAVDRAFKNCLYREEEVAGVQGVPEGAVLVPALQATFGFHPGRLQEQRHLVESWLKALPRKFREEGGDSFLNACMQENGTQWTGVHRRMEQLLSMAEGLGLAKQTYPRESWRRLPGGMPFYAVKVE